MKTIAQMEKLFNKMRVVYVKRWMKENQYQIKNLADEDYLAMYVMLEIKEKYLEKRVDK